MAKRCEKLVDVGRRQFLRGTGVVAAGGVAAIVAATPSKADTPLARVNYPSTKLGQCRGPQGQ